MKYTFNGEEVALERWAWAVRYADGSILRQFADDGSFHQIGEVDQSRITRAWLYDTLDPTAEIHIAWIEGMRLVVKYRNFVLNAATTHERRVRVPMIGFKFNGSHSFLYILPDGRVVCAPDENVPLTHFGI